MLNLHCVGGRCVTPPLHSLSPPSFHRLHSEQNHCSCSSLNDPTQKHTDVQKKPKNIYHLSCCWGSVHTCFPLPDTIARITETTSLTYAYSKHCGQQAESLCCSCSCDAVQSRPDQQHKRFSCCKHELEFGVNT